MKTFLRIAAVASFLFCAGAGSLFLGRVCNAGYGTHNDDFLVAAIGLCLVGNGIFVGAILLVAAEKFGRKAEAGSQE